MQCFFSSPRTVQFESRDRAASFCSDQGKVRAIALNPRARASVLYYRPKETGRLAGFSRPNVIKQLRWFSIDDGTTAFDGVFVHPRQQVKRTGVALNWRQIVRCFMSRTEISWPRRYGHSFFTNWKEKRM